MPDDDKAKAEKLAAAKKRVEEMKKKQAAKKKGSKKAVIALGDVVEASASKTEESTSPAATKDKEKETPSLAEQSKMRSASFRGGSISVSDNPPASPTTNPLSPSGETAPDIYRKHVARIEELEKENKRVTQDAANAKKRWERAEEELAARDEDSSSGEDSDDEGGGPVAKLKTEIIALQRQNAQLQSLSNRPRHGSSASVSLNTSLPADMEALLKSKTGQIETMELEISRLRAQLLKPPPTNENEQVAALEEKLSRAEVAAAKAQSELSDLRKSLDRTAEKAVREGSGRSSAETAAANATREAQAAKSERDDAAKRAEALDKKVAAMVGLHKEQDSRMQALRKEKEGLDHEVDELRGRTTVLEKRLARHGGEGAKVGEGGGGLDDEGVDEIEAEERAKLNHRIRDLEAENYDLRRGIWHDKRKNLQTAPDEHFQDVDLGGGMRSPTQRKAGGGLTNLFASGISAITGADQYQGGQPHGQVASAATGGNAAGDDGLLDDDDLDFDEDAFRAAQQQEMGRRLERVKEAKRALKNWEGFRLDLVEARRGGGEGVGDIFEI